MINGVVVFYSLQRRFLYIMGTDSIVVRGPSPGPLLRAFHIALVLIQWKRPQELICL